MESAILYDSTLCTACRGCQVACKQWWELPAVSTTNRGTYENPPDLSSETWNKIRFREIGQNGTVRWLFTRYSCMHCTAAACVWVCPTYARGYHELGFVTIDQERCIGCARCVAYCSFKVPRLGRHDVSRRIAVELGAPRAVAYKCNFCKDRVEDGLTPACVKTCPSGALQFGERTDLVKQGRARVDALKATNPKAYLYGENKPEDLHVMYVLTEDPGVHDLPDKLPVDAYPEFDEKAFPGWYNQAVADGRLSVFPSGAQPGWYLQPPGEPAIGWRTPALWSLLGFGAIGGGMALWWVTRRRERLAKEKQKGREG